MISSKAVLAALTVLLVAACTSGSDGDEQASIPKTSMSPKASEKAGKGSPLTTSASTTSAASESVASAKVVVADDPTALAAQISKVEGEIRDAKTSAAELDVAARTQQAAYRKLVVHPEWDSEVSSALTPAIRPIMEANVLAGRELRQLVRKPKDTLPAWEIVAPEPIEVLRAAYQAGEESYGVPWEYLAAVHLTETRMGRIRGISTAGARGPMQFLPSTWDAYGKGDIENTHDSIAAAARYLAANGAPERMGDALYRYNPTSHYVDAVTQYAKQMQSDERAFAAYYHWQVYYATTLGDVLLPVGYRQEQPRAVTSADL